MDFQYFDVNLEFRSDRISAGNPCNVHIPQVNLSRRLSAFLFCFLRGMKYAILVNLSMITQSWSQPSLKRWSVIISTDIDFHGE
jgi:hypothetical protein